MAAPSFDSFTKAWHTEPYPFISPSRAELSASGKNVVITGGGTGIGKATAIAFAQAGAKSVAMVGRRVDRLQGAAEEARAANSLSTVLYEAGDVTSRASMDKALRSISDKVGKIDIFVSNAGVLPRMAPVIGYNDDEIRRAFDVIFMGAFHSLQAFLPLAAPGAKVLNTGSAIGHWAPKDMAPGVFSYASFKSAALKMFDYFAAENPHIHVVSIQPGIIATEINPEIETVFDTGEHELETGPTTRIGKTQADYRCPVELPAHFFVWLASQEAEFLRGKFVWANWDAEELLARRDEIRSSMLLQVTLNGVNV